ncbi:MAG: FCD domain-containing protein [Nocardioides sp.]|uniref:FadR/GntR family transcriptional regulator n=1 Tax=Nocardioides sp. TaxID=35761 RepID=UPI0039E610A5
MSATDSVVTDAALTALADPSLAGITRLSALETVRARLALAVELGLLPPGARIPPKSDLAEAFGVSEVTVRRAMISLADDGVLVRQRGRSGGTFVAPTPHAAGSASGSAHTAVEVYRADAHVVHALIDQRALIESALAHHAALVATSEQLAELDELVVRAGHAADWPTYHAIDRRFHLAAAEAAGQPWAMKHYREVLDRLYGYFLPYPVEELHTVNAQEHARYVEALRARDVTGAVEAMQHHVRHLHSSMYVGLPAQPRD